MQAQAEVQVTSGKCKCRGRGISRGGSWWRRESAQGARCTLQRQLEAPKRRRRRKLSYQDGERRREGRRGERWAAGVARGSWERRRGLRTHSQLQWKSAASRAKQKRKDQPEVLPKKMMGPKRLWKTECVPRGQPVATKETRKPKNNTLRRKAAARETQA